MAVTASFGRVACIGAKNVAACSLRSQRQPCTNIHLTQIHFPSPAIRLKSATCTMFEATSNATSNAISNVTARPSLFRYQGFVNGETLTHSPLCNVCAAIFTTKFDDTNRQHHETEDALRESAEAECCVCICLYQRWNMSRKAEIAKGRATIFQGTYLQTIGHQGAWDLRVSLYIQIRLVTISPLKRSSTTKVIVRFWGMSEKRALSLGMPHTLGVGTGDAHSMVQARAWIDQCRTGHNRCEHSNKSVQLPTRLVRVVAYDDSSMQSNICDGSSLPSDTDYLTLSHRWGTKPALTLTTANIDQFRQAIPGKDLSRVFQQALIVTAALGFSYIWIDCLCIAQDDGEDWARESASMHHTYRNAVCNLATSEFASPEEEMVVPRRDGNPLPPVVRVNELQMVYRDASSNKKPEAIPLVEQSQAFVLVQDRHPFGRIRRAPLFRRAWVLQEQILVRQINLHDDRSIDTH